MELNPRRRLMARTPANGPKAPFFLDNYLKIHILVVQSESVTLSVDYLISSAQAGSTCLGFFLGSKAAFILTGFRLPPFP
jgi:hypothetical protein